MKKRVYSLSICFILFAIVAGADIVSYVDGNGTEWFVNDVSQIPTEYRGQAETVIRGKDNPLKFSSHQKKGFFETLKEKWDNTFKKEKKSYSKTKKKPKKKYTYKKVKQSRKKAKKEDPYEKKREEIRKRLTHKPQAIRNEFEPGRMHSKGSY